MLAARVGRFDLAKFRRRVVAVQPVEEDYAGLTVLPREIDDEIEDLASILSPHLNAAPRITQRVVIARENGGHELLGEPHRDVEVVQYVLVFLGADELHDVRVVHAKNAHVGSAPCAPLLDGFRSRVEDAHEGDGPARDTHRGSHEIVLGPEATEAEPGAPS